MIDYAGMAAKPAEAKIGQKPFQAWLWGKLKAFGKDEKQEQALIKPAFRSLFYEWKATQFLYFQQQLWMYS